MRKRTILWQRNLKYFAILVAALVVVIVLVRWISNLHGSYSQASLRYEQAQVKQEALVARKQQLEERNKLLHTTTGKRDFLVDRRAMIGEGERVLVLVENPQARESVDSGEQDAQTSWWQWWSR